MKTSHSRSDVTSAPMNATSRDFSAEHTTSAVLGFMVLTCGTYLLFSLMYYEYRVAQKNKQVTNRRKKLKSIIVDVFADQTRTLCLIAAILAVLRYIFDIIEVFQARIPSDPCRWLRHVKAVLQSGAITCIYLVLWLRQRQFYRMPALAYLSGRITRFFSGAVIVIMMVANLLTIVLYLATRAYESTARGCTVQWSTVWNKLPGLFLFIFTTSFQLILVGLLVYPLYKHSTASLLPENKRQINLIKRVSVAAVVAVISTAVASILSITVLSGNYGALRQIVFSIDILVSLLCIIVSFRDWKGRLLACFVSKDTVIGTVKRRRSGQVTDHTTSHFDGSSQAPQHTFNSI